MTSQVRSNTSWTITRRWWNRWTIAGLAGAFGVLGTFAAEPMQSNPTEGQQVPVALARDRARLMHDVYAATLHVMHERYFHGERAMVPARALEDVFTEIKRQSRTDARWIAVNLKAMSINHEPKSDFEKSAAKAIAEGKSELEVVEDGYYRRAGAIPLADGCISCHAGLFKEASKTPKFAALVISVPLSSDSGKSQ